MVHGRRLYERSGSSMGLCGLVGSMLLACAALGAQQFRTINEAIRQAGDGEVILVAPGEYRERINTMGKSLSIVAAVPDPNVPGGFRPGGNSFDHIIASPDNLLGPSLVTVVGAPGTEVVLEGFKITEGWAPVGGAVSVVEGAYADISRCVVAGNQADGFGGGIFVDGLSSLSLVSSAIVANKSGQEGGALFVEGVAGALERRLALVGCSIAVNTAPGPAITIGPFEGPVCLSNNIIIGNNAAVDLLSINPLIIDYSVLSTRIEGIQCEVGCQFYEELPKDLFVDIEQGNFRLPRGSPAIDAGFLNPPCLDRPQLKSDSESDFEGDPPYDEPDAENTGGGGLTYKDIGGDEYLPSFVRADANADGQIDIGDPVSVLDYLFAGGSAFTCDDATDSNDDGTQDISDAIFTFAYLFSSGPIPPTPHPLAGTDPTDDPLRCEFYPPTMPPP